MNTPKQEICACGVGEPGEECGMVVCWKCERPITEVGPTAARTVAVLIAERDGYRDALGQIMVRCQQGNEPQAAMTRAHHLARRALAAAPRDKHDTGDDA